jgi:RNA polymerase sigma factor (sigma-70 family)
LNSCGGGHLISKPLGKSARCKISAKSCHHFTGGCINLGEKQFEAMISSRNSNGKFEERPVPGSGSAVSDGELVRAVRCGDKRAFVEIVARHQAMVCGVALGILGDFAASEDAAQEAFLTAWRKFSELREPERLRPWLAQIARNSALGHLRRRRGHEPLETAPNLPDDALRPDEAAVKEEEAALVRASLAKLPETYRLPLVLYYREGQSVRAVAEALSLSEDAVKQRLARGRELLRDQMSGLVETVLTRTYPTAVFTMSIAVAIGALAAPSAIAGGVFAATTVATGSTTATTSSLLSAISTSKTLLVSAAIIAVACIPVGYQIAPRDPKVGDSTALVGSNPTNAPAKDPAAPPNFESSELFAEWQQLHDVHGRTAENMPALHKAIGELNDTFRKRAFHAALIAEWTQLDATNGFKFFLGEGRDAAQRNQFFEEWLALDPAAAVNGLLSASNNWQGMARNSLSEIARRVPSRLAEVVARLPKPESYWDTGVTDAFAVMADRDLNGALRAANGMSGPNREPALAGVARIWGRSDLQAATTWAKALPEEMDRDELIRSALIGQAAVNPLAALELAGSVPPGGRHAYFATTTGARVLREAAKADFEGTAAWLAANPGRFGHEDMLGIANAVAERLNTDARGFLDNAVADGSLAALMPAIDSALLNDAGGQRAAVWNWLRTRPDDEASESLRNEVLRTAAWQDPKLALSLAREFPDNEKGTKQINELAQAIFNGGQELDRFDYVLAQASERLREPLIRTAFEHLNHVEIHDPQSWIGRLPLLPEAERGRAIESIAGAWARQSPEEAISWAGSLTSGDTRAGAVAAITSGWANKDARGAADWVGKMSPGNERDRGAEALVMSVADKFPQEAWEWALSIGESAGRTRAATQAAKMMMTRDATTARQWIETGPFPPQIKEELQTSLAKLPRQP